MSGQKNGASEGSRTLDNHLGKVTLYQLSYAREENGPHSTSSRFRLNDYFRLSRDHRFAAPQRTFHEQVQCRLRNDIDADLPRVPDDVIQQRILDVPLEE